MRNHSGRTRDRLCKSRACFGNINPLPARVWEGSTGQVVSEGTASRSQSIEMPLLGELGKDSLFESCPVEI